MITNPKKMLDNKTKARIAAAGRKHWLNTKGDQGELDYIAGAEAEAERIQPLVDAVEEWVSFDDRIHTSRDAERMMKRIREALTNYNNPK